MHNYKTTKAIVLLRENVGEADRRIVFFTQEFGKLVAIAKGIRKLKAKLASDLELFNIVNIELANNTIISAKQICSFIPFNNSFEEFEKAYTIAELLNEFTFEGNKDDILFKLLFNIFSSLKPIDLAMFENRFLDILGFAGANPKNIKKFLRSNLL